MSTEFFNDQWRIPSNENQNKISNYSMDKVLSNSKILSAGSSVNGTSDISVSIWFKSTSVVNSKYIWSFPFSDGGDGFSLRTAGAGTQLSMLIKNAGAFLSGTFNWSDGNWHHIVVTYDGATLKFYTDGSLNGSHSITTTISNAINEFYVGAFSAPTYLTFGALGSYDQTTIFDYALSQDQVTQLGAEGYAFNFIPNDYIDLGTTTAYDTGDLSAAIWVKITDNGTTQYIFSNSGSPAIKGFDIKVRGNNEIGIQRYNTTNGAGSGWISPGFVYDTWQHLAFTYEESTGTIKTFLNGNLVATDTGTSTATLVSEKLTIGSYKGTQAYTNGELSNAVVFNSKLEDSEIATIYNNGKPGDISSLNPVAWYKLDDTEVFNTTSTEWSVDNNALPSTYKSSLDFDGGNDYIDISSSAATTFNNLSFSGWLNWDGSQYSSVFSFSPINGQDTGTGFVIEVRAGGEVRVGYAGQSWGVIVSSAITASTWTHIAVTLSATGGVILYKNGVSIGTNTATPGAPIYKTAFIGARAYGSTPPPLSGQYFGGTLSNIALWNTTLIASQITTLYNNGTPESSISHSPIAWYKLNNLTTGIQDSVGSNNGTNNGAIEYAGFVNVSAVDSVGMDISNLVASSINGELIANPMATNPKPIAYYQLGDQSVDNGANYLVPNNSLSDYVFDWFGGANGTLIQVPSTSSFAFGSGGFGVSLWINFNSVNVAYNILDFRANGAAAAVGSLWFDPASGVRWYVAPGYKSANIPASSFSINTWYNIVVVNNGSTIYFYLNGNLVDSTTDTTVYIAAPLTIGAYSGGSHTAALSGKLSNISIFNTALLTADIQTIYNNGSPNDISSLSPVAWYKLNDSEIFNNTSTEWSIDNNAYPSVYNSSLDFDGSNDSVDCGNGSSLDITGALSISFWIYGETNLAHKGIVSKCPSSGSIPTVAQYHIQYQTNNTLRFVLRNFDLYTGKETTGTVPTVDLNTWQHITMTWNGTNTMTVYKNGLPVCTKVQAITNVSNTSPVLLGLRAAGGFLNGKLSNTAIWNTELTSTQITTLYNNGTPASDISSLSPVSWWKLDNTTTGLLDSGSASNNGTNSGATEYAGFVNALAGESSGMDSSNLVVSDLQQTSGYSPYALDFGGISASLKTYTIPAATNTVTLSAWVKRTGATGSYGGVFGVRNSGGSPDFGLCWQLCFFSTDNKIQFRTSSGVGYNYTLTTVTQNDVMPDNTWTHVVGVADGTNIKIYINGALQTDTKTQTDGTLQTPTSNILFAAQGSAGGNPFNGQLSNCARWNVGLTQAQVTEIYNQGVPSNLNTFSGTAPIGWWQLGSNSSFEGDDWTCLDEIGTDYADSNSTTMSNDDIVDGPGYSASGLGSSTIDIKGDAPYSTANGLSENMDVLDRVSGTGNVPG
jgi:hypothetical protein